QIEADMTLETDDQIRGGLSYCLKALAPGVVLARSADAPPKRRDWKDYSYTHPAVTFFTRDQFAQFGNPNDPKQHEMLAGRLRDFLRSGEFRYTLARGPTDAKIDRVKDFLFDNMQGHCEYFASAMVLMCQALNIPARLVGGYYGGEYNAVGGFYQFRNRDAHTWAEVWLPNRGWVVFDRRPSAQAQPMEGRRGLLPTSRRAV